MVIDTNKVRIFKNLIHFGILNSKNEKMNKTKNSGNRPNDELKR